MCKIKDSAIKLLAIVCAFAVSYHSQAYAQSTGNPVGIFRVTFEMSQDCKRKDVPLCAVIRLDKSNSPSDFSLERTFASSLTFRDSTAKDGTIYSNDFRGVRCTEINLHPAYGNGASYVEINCIPGKKPRKPLTQKVINKLKNYVGELTLLYSPL